MPKTILLLLFALLFFACQEQPKEKQPVVKSMEQKKTTTPVKEVVKEKPKAIPKPPTTNTKVKVKKATPTSVEKELDQQRKDIQRIVRSSLSQPKPGLEIDKGDEWHQERIVTFNALSCSEIFPNPLPKFDIPLRKNYSLSYENTGKDDGQSFCWYQHPTLDQVRIVYTRNEGGHGSDVLSLKSLEKATQVIYGLPLVSWYGREGYECTIESEWLAEDKVRRKIVERLAWKTEGDLDGSLQPRSETTQVFKVLSGGKVEMESEEVVNFNFEEWLEKGE